MRTSLRMRAVVAIAALALLLSLRPDAALAHGQASFARPGIAAGHGSAPGWRNSGSSWAWHNRGDRFGRFRNRFGFLGGGYWYGPDAFTGTGGGGGGPLIVIGASALNSYPVLTESFGANIADGCVIHTLIYNSGGKYVGERQKPEC